MADRLAGSLSPHLLQHASDPVDWHPWGEEAFERARQRDVPVLLSVGYAASHWSRVMGRESFADPAVGTAVDAGFVAVLVDREERPDVAAAHLAATAALTGQAGWPLTVFLTPEGDPFHAGTYYPAEAAPGAPSFLQVLDAVRSAWAARRAEVEATAARIAGVLAARRPPVAGMAGPRDLEAAVAQLAELEDVEHGGFRAPEGALRPPHALVCEFLLRHAAAPGRSASARSSAQTALGLAERTLAALGASAVVDPVGGGTARGALDAAGTVPHPEELLVDAAVVARAQLHRWQLTGAPAARRAAVDGCDWLLRALRTPEGGFGAGLDGEAAERRWSAEQLAAALGDDDGAWAAELLGPTGEEPGAPRLVRDPWADPHDAERWTSLRERLRAAAAPRPQPVRDDAVVTAANGLAVAALAEVGAACGRPDLVEAAARCAELLLRVHRDPAGHLLRVSRGGVAGSAPAALDDHGCLADGLLALHGATGEERWLDAAREVLDAALDRFTAGPPGRLGRQGHGPALHDTPHDALDPHLARLGRPSDPLDGAGPSGASATAGALLGLAALTGSARHRAAAEAVLAATGALALSAPLSAGWGLAVAQAALSAPLGRRVVAHGEPGRGDRPPAS